MTFDSIGRRMQLRLLRDTAAAAAAAAVAAFELMILSEHQQCAQVTMTRGAVEGGGRGGRLWEQPNSGCSRCSRTCDV